MNEMRDRVVQQLSEQFAADRLSLDELERRLDLVYQAASPADLAVLTADLPVLVAPPMANRSLAATGSRPNTVRRIRSFFGNVERSGPMDVPSLLEIKTTLGNVELDLRDASFGLVTEISIHTILGNVEITLPEGVRVENDGGSVLGSFECHVSPGAMPMVGTAPIIRLTGRTILGNDEVHAEPPDPVSAMRWHDTALPNSQRSIGQG